MKVLQERLANISGGRILDVATGPGQFVQRLVNAFQDYEEVIGIDSTESVLNAARKQFAEQEKIHFMEMNAERLDFADNSFDTVCISNSLHHMENLQLVLQEMLRVLKPQGLMIINEMYKDNQTETQISHMMMHHFAAKIDRLTRGFHGDTYNRAEIVEIVQGLGLQDVELLDYANFEDDAKDPEGIEHVLNALEKTLARVSEHPDYSNFVTEGDELKARIQDIGIIGCTQLIVLGRK